MPFNKVHLLQVFYAVSRILCIAKDLSLSSEESAIINSLAKIEVDVFQLSNSRGKENKSSDFLTSCALRSVGTIYIGGH